MASAGAVPVQGCALRVSRLNANGSVVGASATGMVVDDRPFIKFTAKPAIEAGVELNPKSACGALLISYKDYDRTKRWDVTLDIGDFDFDKMELIGGGSLQVAPSSAGRTVADGVTTLNSFVITSATAAFTSADVGRGVTDTTVPANIPTGAYIVSVGSATSATLSAAATASSTAQSLTFGTIAAHTVAFNWPALLGVDEPNGVALEIWQKAMVRGTGYVGTMPYPNAGNASPAPVLGPSAYIRLGVFRAYLKHDAIDIEDKESMQSFVGYAIENPNFGLGPVFDWTATALSGGPPLSTTTWAAAMMDFQLPATSAGYSQTS